MAQRTRPSAPASRPQWSQTATGTKNPSPSVITKPTGSPPIAATRRARHPDRPHRHRGHSTSAAPTATASPSPDPLTLLPALAPRAARGWPRRQRGAKPSGGHTHTGARRSRAGVISCVLGGAIC
jgi:hypothetical protein